jgi:hypothetical protein
MKAYGEAGSTGIALLFRNSSTGLRRVVNIMPWLIYRQVPIEQVGGWATKASLDALENRTVSCHCQET